MGNFRKRKKTQTTELNIFLSKKNFRWKIIKSYERNFCSPLSRKTRVLRNWPANLDYFCSGVPLIETQFFTDEQAKILNSQSIIHN